VKAAALVVLILALAACATKPQGSLGIDGGDYTATRNTDGTIDLLVTASTQAPTPNRDANLQLGPMLESAAAKECPSGYDLRQDPMPTVRTQSGQIIATLGGVARCK
jgi:hypothetical protein